tara:strand:- start:204 stop:1139 length:936 start_codon:yes stop_codon:yes gene_type:complete
MNKYNPRAILGSGIILNTHTEMKVMQPDLIYKTEGNFQEGIFYEFGVPLYPFQYEGWDDSWYLSLPDGMTPEDYQGTDYLWLELSNTPILQENTEPFLCHLHPQQSLEKISVEIHDGDIAELINCNIWIAMQRYFRVDYEIDALFSGLEILRPEHVIISNVGNHHEQFHEYDITLFGGRIWETPFSLRRDFANKCHQCGYGPLYCEKCGYFAGPCPKCKALLSRVCDPENEKRKSAILFPEESPGLRSLMGETWDGKDLCVSSNWVITKRVLDWLLQVEATPFYARPIKVCIDGMTNQQLEWLDRAVEPIG